MSVAVNKVLYQDTNDVFTGELLSQLPSDSPSYDVAIHLDKLTDSPITFTLLVNGTAIMERARVFGGQALSNVQELDIAEATLPNFDGKRVPTIYTYEAEPDATQLTDAYPALAGAYRDNPTVFFNAPAGSRITLNIHGFVGTSTSKSTKDVVSVYATATENLRRSSGRLPVGHQAELTSLPNSYLDMLKGTPIGALPATATAWNISFMFANIRTDDNSNVSKTLVEEALHTSNVSILVDTDTVCEGFLIPWRPNYERFPIPRRDALITTFATGGSTVTFNRYVPTPLGTTHFRYKVYAVPVA